MQQSKYLVYSILLQRIHIKTRGNTNNEARISSPDGTHLRSIGVVICSLILSTSEFEHKVILCKIYKCPVVLGLDFVQDFRVGIDWSNYDKLYLPQDHKPLTCSKLNSSKNSKSFSVECEEVRLIRKTHILLPLKQ